MRKFGQQKQKSCEGIIINKAGRFPGTFILQGELDGKKEWWQGDQSGGASESTCEVIRYREWWPGHAPKKKGKSEDEEEQAGCGDVKSGKLRKKHRLIKTPRIKKVSCIKGIISEQLTYILN